MKILIISPDYPNKYRSNCPFVKQLVDEFARQGHDCCVIAPYNKTHNHKNIIFKDTYTVDGERVIVYRPWYYTISDIKIFDRHLSTIFYQLAVSRALNKLTHKPDIIYGHFWPSAIAGYKYSKKNHIPLFVASGESKITNIFQDMKHSSRFCKDVDGVICVSTKNEEESIRLGLTTIEKCDVFPNAIDNHLFNKIDKNKAREQLGFPSDKFIVVFVGTFKQSKGPDRVSQAINIIKENNIYSIFIGSGPLEPECNNILFKGRLLHEKIPLYLNAADVFVLPTLAEGCCNAIIEAMACGLPIISSNLSFNWDVLNDKNSILIDPMNIENIASAICYLRDNPKVRAQMSEECLKTALSLTISQRASDIISFIQNRIKKIKK